jgi:cob(I)alamin adenosyltransferase
METTSLNGREILKNDVIIHFLGTLDELNSHIGLIKALLLYDDARQFLEQIQKTLMKLMSHVFDPVNEKYFLNEDELNILKIETVRIKNNIPVLHQFIIPGRNVTEAQIHIARTITRRAERFFIPVNELLSPNTGIFLNLLSDYLFTLSQQV